MLPLQSGTPLLDARPVYPADLALAVATAVASGVAAVWLMSTPLQLRAFQRELPALPGLRRIISATMPLDPELAQAIERDWQTPVEEIFGCTEGGILATRRPAQSPHFAAAAGLRFAPASDGATQVSGGHLPQPLTLTDRLVPRVSRFRWRGPFRRDGTRRRHGEDRRQACIACGVDARTAGRCRCGATVRCSCLRLTRRALAAIVAAPGRDRRRHSRRPGGPDRSGLHAAAARRRRRVAARRERQAADRRTACTVAGTRAVPGPAAPARSNGWTGMPSFPPTIRCLPDTFPAGRSSRASCCSHWSEALLARNGYRVRECPQVKFLTPVGPATPLALRIEIAQRTVGPLRDRRRRSQCRRR